MITFRIQQTFLPGGGGGAERVRDGGTVGGTGGLRDRGVRFRKLRLTFVRLSVLQGDRDLLRVIEGNRG
jgi:hypothetical protein